MTQIKKTINFKKEEPELNIENFYVSRLLIKKTFINPTTKKKTILLQISESEAVFIDSKFVLVDEFTLDAKIGIVKNFEYNKCNLLNKEDKNYIKISGEQLIKILNETVI